MAAAPARSSLPAALVDYQAILQNQPIPVVLLQSPEIILYANGAAEDFFQASLTVQQRSGLSGLLKTVPGLGDLARQVQYKNETVFGRKMVIATDRQATLGQCADIHISPLEDMAGHFLITVFAPCGIPVADWPDVTDPAGRKNAGMAAILAHEIKNPLSGIRGAAQLLERNAGEGGQKFTRLITDEVDRICALVDRMEGLSDGLPIELEPVNIHRILQHVKTLAEAGFASRINFTEQYDPSLPRVMGNRDQLVQLFLNLVKNAAESVEGREGAVSLGTAFRNDVRLPDFDKKSLIRQAIEITITDNGGGISDDLADCLFDPFVTGKNGGIGLGLALVAKITADHGGTIRTENRDGGAVFTVLLPVHPAAMKKSEA